MSTTTRDNVAQRWLCKILHPGDRIFIVTRYESPRGTLGVYAIYRHHYSFDPEVDPLLGIDAQVAEVLGVRRSAQHNGLVLRSSGENRMWRLTYELGARLWPEGFACLGERRCPSNEHRTGRHEYGEGIHHSEGGYALRYRSL